MLTAFFVLALAGDASSSTVPKLSAGPDFQRGVALGMYDWNADADYRPDVDQIAATGATDISLIAVYFQDNVTTTTIAPRFHYSPSEANIKRTLAYIKKKGLHAMLFPIVHIINRGPGDWRGKIRPDDWDKWFAAYKNFIVGMAKIAEHENVDTLVVGTEYVSSETMRDRWLNVIAAVRAVYHGKLLYSANWDHFDPVSFWDAVDEMGVTAYHKLTAGNFDPQVDVMARAWDPVKRRLQSFRDRLKKPLIITELGYPSLDGANVYPWDETRQVPIDLEEQRRCYEAFTKAFADGGPLSGIYFWIWFGPGGPNDSGFTSKGKPAEGVIKDFYRK